MAAKPVVAARMGGLPYIVEDGESGFCLRPATWANWRRKFSHSWMIPLPQCAWANAEALDGDRNTAPKKATAIL